MHCALYRKTLKVRCRRCPHTKLLDAVPLWWHFERKRWSDALPEAVEHLYCGACWRERRLRVSGPRYWITDDKPEAMHLPYPDEREWKRITSRYRS